MFHPGALTNVAAVGGTSALTFRISDSLEDGYEFRSGASFITLSQTENFFATGIDSPLTYRGFLRYLNVTIPQGATVTSATITLTRKANPNGGTHWGWLYGVAADDAAQFSTPGNRPFDAAKTTARVLAANGASVTLNVTAIVQEIVNRAGWASGNDMAFTFDPTDANGYIEYYSFNAAGALQSKSPLKVVLA